MQICFQASGARDALAKHIYASLFQWLISIMNRTMCETSPSVCLIKITNFIVINHYYLIPIYKI